MPLTRYRWGRKARLLAGACLSIALREVNSPESVYDISHLLNEAPSSLSRTILSALSLLQLTLPPADATMYVTKIQSRFDSILQSGQHDFDLPPALVSILCALPLRAIVSTTNALLGVLPRLTSEFEGLTTGPTACAAFMLAAEAEYRSSFTGLAKLAESLAGICQVGKHVVMSRYKLLQAAMTPWIQKLDWLQTYNIKKGRAKVSQRLVVIRALHDIIQFQEELFQSTPLPTRLSINDDSESGVDEGPSESNTRPRKRFKLQPTNPMQEAAGFLLDPLSAPLPNLGLYAPYSSVGNLPLTSYILDGSLNFREPLTRLQILTRARGGADSDQILDEELFDEGEFEGLLRSQEEMDKVRALLGWVEETDKDPDVQSNGASKTASTSLTHTDVPNGHQQPRIDMNAFAIFMQDSYYDSNSTSEDGEEEFGDTRDHFPDASKMDDVESGVIVLKGWGSSSPSPWNAYDNDDRYEQEYD